MARRTHSPDLRWWRHQFFGGARIMADQEREAAKRRALERVQAPAGPGPAPAVSTESPAGSGSLLAAAKKRAPRSEKRGARAINPIESRKDGNNSGQHTG
jgi:hypothetical protein